MSSATTPAAEYETLAQAAARWAVSTKTLRRAIARQELRAYRLNAKAIRVKKTEVDALWVATDSHAA